MSENIVERLCRDFGSQQALADAVGVSQPSVSAWVASGSIPPKRWLAVLQAAQQRGVKLSHEDLFKALRASEVSATAATG